MKPKLTKDGKHSQLFDAGHLAYQLGQPCEDREPSWKDGWFAAQSENLHLDEEWASLFPRGDGFTMHETQGQHRRREIE